jgi:hypothetical protein
LTLKYLNILDYTISMSFRKTYIGTYLFSWMCEDCENLKKNSAEIEFCKIDPRGRCYDLNFLWINWRFPQKPMLWSNLCRNYCIVVWAKNCFSKYLKNRGINNPWCKMYRRQYVKNTYLHAYLVPTYVHMLRTLSLLHETTRHSLQITVICYTHVCR